MKLPSISDITLLSGVRVLVRLDLNVPFEGDVIRDTFRIDQAIPTIRLLREGGARVLIISHHSDEKQTLRPVAEYLAGSFSVRWGGDVCNPDAALREDDEIVLCENLRQCAGEEENDETFARHLASLADVYINDAFGVAHRTHASIVGVPTFLHTYFGPLFCTEIKHLSHAFSPEHPALLILGGAKISTKLPLVEAMLGTFDHIFIGGALMNNLFKAKGYEIGHSLYDEAAPDVTELLSNPRIMIPEDVVVRNGSGVVEKAASAVAPDEMIRDCGPRAIAALGGVISRAKFILVNGPLGDYEERGFEKGTVAAIRHIQKSDAYAIIGGGDSVALLDEAGLEGAFDFVSTGGGAMLAFLIHKTLPAIDAVVGIKK